MSAAAPTDSVSFAFGGAAAERYGLARLGRSRDADGEHRASALCVLFAGREPVAAVAQGGLEPGEEHAGLRIAEAGPERWSVAWDAGDGQGFELAFEAIADPVRSAPLGGMEGAEQPCRVEGVVRSGGAERSVSGLGQRSLAWGDPDWAAISLARTVSAWSDAAAATLVAVRPDGATHHDAEESWAAWWEPEGPLEIEDGRLSTTYDGEGRMRRAALELWPGGEEAWPRRVAGELLCGSSLDLGALRLDCSFFTWRVEGRAGVGRYDILRRA